MLQSGWKCLDVSDVNFVDEANKYSMKEQHCRWGSLCYILPYCKLNVWLPFFSPVSPIHILAWEGQLLAFAPLLTQWSINTRQWN